ncbi:Microfibrillar-associated protein 1 [Tupaia chinensis]|uniref:Microfibrillar-associated protein 1 n=1 Tax=Tupaia chinensis TaxID=246437 RepID=L9JPZ3_TUPCH|nr:Microfibrillar-associated protein 1 [Tupaia chinensis]
MLQVLEKAMKKLETGWPLAARDALNGDDENEEENLTEEERRAQLQANVRVITNQDVKGKCRFLQKYYHWGTLFMDKEEDVYKRDFSVPTLEDHFDKIVLPKVIQVKNFVCSGWTKYTHLVDQDTTSFDSAWGQESAPNRKFFKEKAAGVQDVFERPSAKKQRTV